MNHYNTSKVCYFRCNNDVELLHDFEQFSANTSRRVQFDRHERLGRSVYVFRVLEFHRIRHSEQYGKEENQIKDFKYFGKLQCFKGEVIIIRSLLAIIYTVVR